MSLSHCPLEGYEDLNLRLVWKGGFLLSCLFRKSSNCPFGPRLCFKPFSPSLGLSILKQTLKNPFWSLFVEGFETGRKNQAEDTRFPAASLPSSALTEISLLKSRATLRVLSPRVGRRPLPTYHGLDTGMVTCPRHHRDMGSSSPSLRCPLAPCPPQALESLA